MLFQKNSQELVRNMASKELAHPHKQTIISHLASELYQICSHPELSIGKNFHPNAPSLLQDIGVT
jgi:hypothetical protein